MRGFGDWVNRDRVYTVTDTNDATMLETFTVVGPPLLEPDWGAETYSYRGGMGIPAAWRAVRLLADLMGSMPWHAYREGTAGSPLVCITPTPLLLDQPSPPETRVETFSALAMDYWWHGTAVAMLGPMDSRGNRTSMLPVSAERVWGAIVKGRAAYTVDGVVIPREDLLVVKAPCSPGSIRGYGILENHFRAIDQSRSQIRQSAVANAGVPTGVLQSQDPDISQGELTAAKRDWLISQYKRTIAALPPGVEFKPISWNPSEMQMVEARKFDLQTWELIFGLPVGFLGGEGPSMRYANMEQDAINLLKFTLNGALVRFEQALSQCFLSRRVWVKGNVDSILRADTLARYNAHKLGIDAGWLLKNEARELEDRAPIPGLDAPDDPTLDPNAPPLDPNAPPEDPNAPAGGTP